MHTHPSENTHLRYLHLLNVAFLTGQHSFLYNNASPTTSPLKLPWNLSDTFLSYNTQSQASISSTLLQYNIWNHRQSIHLFGYPRYLKVPLLDMTCTTIFTSTLASSVTILNLHATYSVGLIYRYYGKIYTSFIIS